MNYHDYGATKAASIADHQPLIAYGLAMRTSPRIGIAIACSLLLGSCAAGPHQLRRTVDDWDQKIYVNSPWLNASMWVVPVYPVAYAGALAFDFVIGDPWPSWCEDAWDGNGTGFRHIEVEWTDGWVESLLSDRSRWTRTRR